MQLTYLQVTSKQGEKYICRSFHYSYVMPDHDTLGIAYDKFIWLMFSSKLILIFLY